MGISDNLLNLMDSFLSERYQRVLLNGQSYEWASITAGVPQGWILGPLLFLIYINDRSEDITSNVKLFADDTSIFSTVYNINIWTSNLNSDLQKVSVVSISERKSIKESDALLKSAIFLTFS